MLTLSIGKYRILLLKNHILGHQAVSNAIHGRDFVHDVLHQLLDDGPKATGTCLALQGLLGNAAQCLIIKGKLHPIQIKQVLILLVQLVSCGRCVIIPFTGEATA